MSNKKYVLINKIDVSYRSIEDLDNQYDVMFNILNSGSSLNAKPSWLTTALIINANLLGTLNG